MHNNDENDLDLPKAFDSMQEERVANQLNEFSETVRSHYFRTMVAYMMTKLMPEAEALGMLREVTLPIFREGIDDKAENEEQAELNLAQLEKVGRELEATLHQMFAAAKILKGEE
jgi:hypothetical protein